MPTEPRATSTLRMIGQIMSWCTNSHSKLVRIGVKKIRGGMAVMSTRRLKAIVSIQAMGR
jgi:hypothetical protein